MRKNYKQKSSNSEETRGSPGEEVKLRPTGGVGFVKQVGFKPGVKERGSYGYAEW